MKKLLYTFLMLSFIFSACKKDENSSNSGSTNNTSSSIIGGWDFAEMNSLNESGYYLGGYPNGTRIITSAENQTVFPGDTGSPYIQSIFWEFKEDGNLNETFINTLGEVNFDNYAWVKTGDYLILDTNVIWSIVTLSSSQLIINSMEEDTSTYWWDPNNDTIYYDKYNSTVKFNRSSLLDNSNLKRINYSQNSFLKTFINRRK